jgi:hypothetical protein
MQCESCGVEIDGKRVYLVLSKEVHRDRLQELYPDGVADICADCFYIPREYPPVQTGRRNDVGQQIVLLYNHAKDWHTDAAERGLAAAERAIEDPYLNREIGTYWNSGGPEDWDTSKSKRNMFPAGVAVTWRTVG